MTCAECSSLGLDKWVGNGEPPTRGVCSSCGGPWPLLTITLTPEDTTRLDMLLDMLLETTGPSEALFAALHQGRMEMKRFLIKPPESESLPASVQERIRVAVSRLTSSQLDRYYRATKVWYNTQTEKFEFEDCMV